MGKFQRLNGWRRLWVVVAAGALLFAIGWGFFVGLNNGMEMYSVDAEIISGYENPSCTAVIQMPAGTKLNPSPRGDNPCWRLYVHRSVSPEEKTKDDYIETMNSRLNQFRWEMAGLALAGWLLSVTLLYGLGTLAAWVLKGFRSNEET